MATSREPGWTLGDRLRKAREHAGLDQRELAARLTAHGYVAGQGAVSKWEQGKTKQPRDLPTLAQLIEEITEVDAAWVLGLAEPVRLPTYPAESGHGRTGDPRPKSAKAA